MGHRNRTKDENYVLSLYEEATATGDPENTVDRYRVGERVNLHPKAVDTICKLLIQANFIKKDGQTNIYLTQNGLRLVETLKEQSL